MPSYEVKINSEYGTDNDKKTSSTSYYKMHTDSLMHLIDSALNRKKKNINQLDFEGTRKIIKAKIKKVGG